MKIIKAFVNTIILFGISYLVPVSVHAQSCSDIGNIYKISPTRYQIETFILPDCPEEDVFKMLNKATKKILKKSGYKYYLIGKRNDRLCIIQLYKDTTEKFQAIKVLMEKKDKFKELSQKYLIGTTPYNQLSDDIKTLGGTEHQVESKESFNPYHQEILEVVEFGGLFKFYVRIKDGILDGFKLVDAPLEFPEQ